MNRQLFNNGLGNEEFANLPRKINVCISPSRDDFPHTQVCAGLSHTPGRNMLACMPARLQGPCFQSACSANTDRRDSCFDNWQTW
jgi:hypothetical protein